MFFDIARIARQSQKSPTEDSKLEDRLRAEARLGNTTFNPWPQKLLNEAADFIASLRGKVAERTELLHRACCENTALQAKVERLERALATIDFEARENKQTDKAFRTTLRRIVNGVLREK